MLQNSYKNKITSIKDYAKNHGEIECFIGKINQVFMNIIGNAIDAISDKGEITIKTEQLNDAVRIRIKDNGAGMSQENITKIFDPFFTTKEIGKGTGLGLPICLSIIHDHNGKIELKSKIGEGTEFIITLPTHHKST